MIPITLDFLTSRNRPKQPLTKLKGIVIHYTGNFSRGANAQANRNYFNKDIRVNGKNIFASAHYVVDDQKVIQCIPDEEVAFHCGAVAGLPYTALANKIRENKSTNYFLLGIEMCVNVDSTWEKTYQNTVELTASLMVKHSLGIEDVYRHFDITHKICPRMMVEDPQAWVRFKNDVVRALSPNALFMIKTAKVLAKELNVRSTPVYDRKAPKINFLKSIPRNQVVQIYGEDNGWARIGQNEWVNAQYLSVIN